MTHYIVCHDESDYRLHAEDGTEPVSTSWSERPSTNDITNAIADAGPGGSLLGDEVLRQAFVDAVSGGLRYRDLTTEGETVPWR